MPTYKVTVHFIHQWIESSDTSAESVKRRVHRQLNNGELMFAYPEDIVVGVKKIR
jgi:hypothetical protein